MHWQQHRNTGKHIHAMTMDLLLLLSTEAYASFWTLWIAMLFKHFDLSVSFILSSHVRDKTFRSKSKSFFPSQVKICISVDQTTLSPQTTAYTTRIALATRGRHWSPSSRKRTRWAPCLGDGTRPRTVSWGRWNSLPSHCIFSTTLSWLPARQRLIGTFLLSLAMHSTAHAPAMKSLSRMNSSWAAAASDPSEECMVTVSTLERQHMASWSGTTSASSRATLGRGSHKRPGTDPSHHNGHAPTNSTERREHCECRSPWGPLHAALEK